MNVLQISLTAAPITHQLVMTTRPVKILLADDDADMRELLHIRLQQWGFDVHVASDGEQARDLVESVNPDLVISDVLMPKLSGLDLVRWLKAGNPDRPVLLFTIQASVDLAVEAMKLGAQDFLTKPLDFGKLKASLDSILGDVKSKDESKKLAVQLEKGAGFRNFVGISRAMRELYTLIQSVSQTDTSVLITGESGTGKELVARSVHDLSARASGPFIAINTAAIPETLIESEIFGHEKGAFTGAIGMHQGCFEMAHQGTLFLDEIAEMPSHLQPRLLRVLQDGRLRRVGGRKEFEFDVRVIAATNLEVRSAIENGKLREDLYYRLNVFGLRAPPLRERKEDIHLLAQHFIRESNQKHGTQVEALRARALKLLVDYSWPGNVREMRNVIERAVILAQSDWIETSHLPAYLVEENSVLLTPSSLTAADAERELILKTLKGVGNKKSEAARRLGLDVKTIRNKLKSYGMGAGSF
jgi:DNA-binding NtrC family response regulator